MCTRTQSNREASGHQLTSLAVSHTKDPDITGGRSGIRVPLRSPREKYCVQDTPSYKFTSKDHNEFHARGWGFSGEAAPLRGDGFRGDEEEVCREGEDLLGEIRTPLTDFVGDTVGS